MLITKWKQHGQRAANCLYNDAKAKIERMRGTSRFGSKKRQQRKRQKVFGFDDSMLLEIEDSVGSEQWDLIDEYDKQGVLKLKKKLEVQQKS